MPNIDIAFGKPMVGHDEEMAIMRVLASGQLVHGQVTHQFEAKFAERIGVRHAVAVSSCTAGLHLSLFARGIGPGDEVIVPAMTHVATAHAASLCGAIPRFVDVEPTSGNMDPVALEAQFSGKTKAVIVVHFLGLPCDMDRIKPLVRRSDSLLLEDCALAVDATFDDRKTGTLGDAGCFSFYPIKHMTSIEGGMVTTNDAGFAALLTQVRAFGYDRAPSARTKPGIYDVNALGFNYRMSEVEAAVGLVQLSKLDHFQKRRAENFERLRYHLSDIAEITVFSQQNGKAKGSHYCLNAILPKDGSVDRDKVAMYLKSRGIGSSVHYPRAVPLMTYYRERFGFREGQFPVAEWLAAQTVSLPVGPHLGIGDMDRIAEAMKEAVQIARV